MIQDGKVDSDLLDNAIRYNVHLHDIIKENLLGNLKHYHSKSEDE